MEHEAKLGCMYIFGYKKIETVATVKSSPIEASISKHLWLSTHNTSIVLVQCVQKSCVHDHDAVIGRWSLPWNLQS